MMVLNSGAESYKSSTSRNRTSSKSSVKCRTSNEDASRDGKIKEGLPLEKVPRVRSKTSDGTDAKSPKTPPAKRPASADNSRKSSVELNRERSEMNFRKKPSDTEKEEGGELGKKAGIPVDKRNQTSTNSVDSRKAGADGSKKVLVYEKPSETYSKLYKEGKKKVQKPKAETLSTRPSEIPKLKQLAKMNWKRRTKTASATTTAVTKAPSTGTTTMPKSADADRKATAVEGTAKESDSIQGEVRSQGGKTKKEMRADDKIRNALNENFSSLVPLYETELKKITDTWVNTTYCSLTTRTNLVKLLHDILPNINKAQFQMEDETILQSITRTKTYTKSEAENLLQFIKLLIGNRNKVKDDYIHMMSNKEIADLHNNNWRNLTKRIADLGDETRQIQVDIADLTKKRENYETMAADKIHKMQVNLTQKEEEIKKLANQLSILKQRENSYKGNVSLKIEDYKDIKEEVLTLKSIEKEFEELKAKYHCQNDNYEKKIKDLEVLLEERKKALKKENEVKTQLQSFLLQLHSHQRHLYKTIGKEQVDFVMGRPFQSRNKRREQLWLSAIKLVLKGFQVQTKKLERDKNKMLLELNSNDLDNYNALATAIMQKDNFIKSIRHQMHAFHMATKYPMTKTSESSVLDPVKTSTASRC